MDDQSWVKLWRKSTNTRFFKCCELWGFWCQLLLLVNYKEGYTSWGVKTLPGQFCTGRKALSAISGLSESKVERFLKKLEIEHQIEQQKTSKYRIITIVNWATHQATEQDIEQQANNKRTTSEQQVNTNKKDKKEKKRREEKKSSANAEYQAAIIEIIDYLNKRVGRRFQVDNKTTNKNIISILREGFKKEDIQGVIDYKQQKVDAGKEDAFYMRPSTLFRPSNFHNYFELSKEKQAAEESSEDLYAGEFD